jgi:hypothetical protein
MTRRRLLLAATGGLGALAIGATLPQVFFPAPEVDPRPYQELKRIRLSNRQPLLNEDVRGLFKEHLGGKLRRGSAPRVGAVEYGGYMEEAFRAIGISGASRSHFHQVHVAREGYSLGGFGFERHPGIDARHSQGSPVVCRYGLYRRQVAALYGVPLADANYFSFNGETNPKVAMGRAYELGLWIAEATAFGTPTVGLQLDTWRGAPWDVFRVSKKSELHPEMAAFRDMALCLQKVAIGFNVRFLSESEMENSPYSSHGEPDRFLHSMRLFRDCMPENVSVVYSPSCASSTRGILSLIGGRRRRGRLPFDILGGTLYSSVNGSLEEIYGRFHARMIEALGPERIMICELGAPISRKVEVLRFLKTAEEGKYAGLKRINLFGSALNRSSVSQNRLGKYGFLGDGETRSYLHDHLAGAA